MIKILHTADIHLDSPLKSLALRDPDLRDRVQAATRGAFTRIVDMALDEDVAGLLIAGDLYDGAARSARTAAFLTAQFDRLRAAGIPVFLIKGNHDAENPITGEVKPPDNVHIFGGRDRPVQLVGEDVWIHGVSFTARHAPDSLLPKFAAPVEGAVNIAMLHSSLSGATGHDTYAPCTVAELSGMGFDYWALGHIHKHQIHAKNPWVVMPGIPQGRDIGEAGPQSATMIFIDDGHITTSERPTSQVEFQQLEVDATDCADDDGLRARIRQALHCCASELTSDTAILRIRLTGPFERRWQVERDRDTWTETVAGIARETGSLWIEKLDIALTDPSALQTGTSATAELSELMQTIRAEPGFSAAIEAQLADLLSDLPAHSRTKLIPDEDAATALAQRLAKAGATHITALMKGASE